MKRFELIENLENRFHFYNGSAINVNDITDKVSKLVREGKDINSIELYIVKSLDNGDTIINIKEDK